MKKLIFGSRNFACLVRCTITSESLRDLANALAAGGPTAFHEVIVDQGEDAAVRSGRRTRVDLDGPNRPRYLLTFANGDCDTIAESLMRLADEPDRNAISLSELGLLTVETSNFDLEFFKLDEVPELMHDYEPSVDGSTWEGVLYHDAPSFTQFEQVRDIVSAWDGGRKTRQEFEMLAQSPESKEIVDPLVAHQRLLDPNDDTYQINIYIEHPLTTWYGNPHTGAQIWLTKDQSEIILSEHCVASGDFQVDINNFFSYRRVLMSMSDCLKATGLAWGECADRWPRDEVVDPATFNDQADMWTNFEATLTPCLSDAKIPHSIREAFNRKFMQEIAPARS